MVHKEFLILGLKILKILPDSFKKMKNVEAFTRIIKR